MPKKWNFLSNYGLITIHIAQNPRATLREIAQGTDLTERAVYQIVRDLEEGGFIQKKRVGRRNMYTLAEDKLLNYPVYHSLTVAQFTAAIRRLVEETQARKAESA